jgi:CubicO group peptidase (beta-lactamase class C family)
LINQSSTLILHPSIMPHPPFSILPAAFCLLLLPLSAKQPLPQPLPVADPEEVGMSAKGLAKIKPAVEQLIADQKLAGGSVLILRKGHLVYQEEFGHRDIAADAPIEKDTIFRIYSMTKSITSAAILILHEEGKLNIDDPIAKLLPEFKDVTVWSDNGDPVTPTRPPTIRDLLRHTGGLTYGWGPTEVHSRYQELDPLSRSKTLAEMATTLAGIPLLYQPGTQWVYSVSTDLLGRLVEVASDQSFDTFLHTRLFTPLGMPDTGFSLPEEKAKRFSVGYTPRNGTLLPVMPIKGSPYFAKPKNLSGGAGLVSTITDYARFLQMIANGGTFQGKRYLKEDTVALMTTNQLPETIPHISFGEEQRFGTGFGLGFSIRTKEDPRWAPHAPLGEYGWGGMASTHYWISPKDELVVITMEQTLPYNWNLERTLKPIIYNAIKN